MASIASVAVCRPRSRPMLVAWAPLVLLPLAACLLCSNRPAWQEMSALAFSVFFACKWLSFATCAQTERASACMAIGYLLLWPGMDADAFFKAASSVAKPRVSEAVGAVLKSACGVVLVFSGGQVNAGLHPVLAGWTLMVGLVFVFHFGLFHLLSVCWRMAGIDARPIMNWPILAASLGDFWGRRWNLAFRDLAHRFVFRPLLGRLGTAGATMVVFFASGLVHDLVISLPAGGGWGGPTLYFLIQGAGVLLEHSRLGRKLGLAAGGPAKGNQAGMPTKGGQGTGVAGRCFAAVLLVGPLGLLFHVPFITRVITPMLAAFAAH